MKTKKDSYLERQKMRCLEYCLKKGIKKAKAMQISKEYEQTGLAFPEELIFYEKVVK